jgi:hypothetical protein
MPRCWGGKELWRLRRGDWVDFVRGRGGQWSGRSSRSGGGGGLSRIRWMQAEKLAMGLGAHLGWSSSDDACVLGERPDRKCGQRSQVELCQ